jgi:hypothetical protein
MNRLLANAIDAHGGLERWKQFRRIEVDLVSGGELLDRKGVRSSGTVRFAAKIHEQIVSFVATSAPDKQMAFHADRIAVETTEGKLIAERLYPRQSFHGHGLNTPWDPLHRGYFSGYAMWSYLTSPFALAVEETQVWDIEPLEKDGELWRGIRAVLPERFATHSRAQEFYFGDDMLLRRQDYTLDIAGGFKVANYASEFIDLTGLKLPSKRRAFLCNKKYDEESDLPLVRLDMSNFRIA